MGDLYVLDTSAIFTFTDQEKGADEVERLLDSATRSACQLEICAMSLMELSYITIQEEGENAAAHLIALVKSWPAIVMYPDEKMLLQAAKLKAAHRLSLADTIIAATAKLHQATLVHKDPEFEVIAHEVPLLTLPYKISKL